MLRLEPKEIQNKFIANENAPVYGAFLALYAEVVCTEVQTSGLGSP
jgi:hypothetical protein